MNCVYYCELVLYVVSFAKPHFVVGWWRACILWFGLVLSLIGLVCMVVWYIVSWHSQPTQTRFLALTLRNF
jgi:hypothetical protein